MSKAHRPQITIAQETVDHLEALVQGASTRMPALADRLLDELSRARILPAARFPPISSASAAASPGATKPPGRNSPPRWSGRKRPTSTPAAPRS